MTKDQLENRLEYVEDMINKANPKDLPYLNDLFQKLINRIVELDIEGKDKEDEKST